MKSVLILGEPSKDFIQGIHQSHGDVEMRIFSGAGVQSARDIFLNEIFQWVLREKPLVVTYSSGWKGEAGIMAEIFSHLTGRSPESIQYFLFDMGVEIKSLSFTQGLLSIKDLMTAMDQTQLSDQQRLRFQVLGELIR